MGLNYYVIDIESTGLKSDYHEITQISIIRCSDRNQLSRYVRPEFPERTSEQALTATGRTMKDLYKGIPKEEAIDACENFLNEDQQTSEHRCMVGHHVSFDRKFVYALWHSYNKTFPAVCWLDTESCIRSYAKLNLGLQKVSFKLHSSLEHCGLKPRPGAHNAISDTQNTFILMDYLKNKDFDYLPFIKRVPQEEESDNNSE